MNLLDLYEQREPYQQAIDKLEQRRIDMLNDRMQELLSRARTADPQVKAALKREFEKIKSERDSYYSIREAQKGQDVVDRSAKMKALQPAKPGMAGAIKDVAQGLKNFLQGKPETGPTYEDQKKKSELVDEHGGGIGPSQHWQDLMPEQMNPEDYEDEDEDLRLRSGDYVRDTQDGESGEIFRMQGDPYERRVRILDRDGKGWYIEPSRLTRVDPQDPDVQRYFGKKRVRDMDEFDASGYNRYSIYIDNYNLKETFADLDDAVEAIEEYKRDDPKSRHADYNVRDLNGKVVWRNDTWQDVGKPGKIQFLPPTGKDMDEATGDGKFDSMMGKISKDPWTQLNSDPNWEYEIEELVNRHIEPWLLAMEKSSMPITQDEETLNPGWRKRYEQVANQLAQKYLTSKGMNPRDPDLVGKIRYAIDSHTDQSNNVHGQLSAYSDLPLARYQDDFDADGQTANMRDALAGIGSQDDDDDDDFPTRPRPDADPRRLDPGNMEEGWSDAYVSRRTGQPRTPYSVYIKGKKWKDFENDDHARAVMNKLKAKFKADGRDPETITIAPTDIPEDVVEGIRDTASATAVIACLLAGGGLTGCATAPQKTTAQQVLKTGQDIGSAVIAAKRITRAGAEEEVRQELRNLARGMGGQSAELNNSNILRIWRNVNRPSDKPAQYESKEVTNKQEYFNAIDSIDRQLKVETNPANKQILRKQRELLQQRARAQGWIKLPINEIKDTEAVEQAIVKRIMVQHRDLLIKYGPEKIMTAAEDVAYNVGDIGEIGTSDVGGWVRQVQYILGARP